MHGVAMEATMTLHNSANSIVIQAHHLKASELDKIVSETIPKLRIDLELQHLLMLNRSRRVLLRKSIREVMCTLCTVLSSWSIYEVAFDDSSDGVENYEHRLSNNDDFPKHLFKRIRRGVVDKYGFMRCTCCRFFWVVLLLY